MSHVDMIADQEHIKRLWLELEYFSHDLIIIGINIPTTEG